MQGCQNALDAPLVVQQLQHGQHGIGVTNAAANNIMRVWIILVTIGTDQERCVDILVRVGHHDLRGN